MTLRSATLLMLTLSAALAFSGLVQAQGGGGGGGSGGRGMGGGGFAPAPRLVQGDVSGPPAADSVRTGLKLDSAARGQLLGSPEGSPQSLSSGSRASRSANQMN